MPPTRIHSLVRALAALSISDGGTPDSSTEDIIPDTSFDNIISDTSLEHTIPDTSLQHIIPQASIEDIIPYTSSDDIIVDPDIPSQHPPSPDPFPSPIARPIFSLEHYRGDASIVRRWAKHPQTLERSLCTAKFPMRKFPLSQPPLGLHWGVGHEDSFLFLGNSPVLVYLPARLTSLDPRKNKAGYGEILLEAEMLDDAYYFGMMDLMNFTGDNPSMDPVFHAYRNTGDSTCFRNCWDCTGRLSMPRRIKPSRFRFGDVVLIECSIRRTGSTYVTWYSFFSLRAVSLLYRPSPWSTYLQPGFYPHSVHTSLTIPLFKVTLSFNFTLPSPEPYPRASSELIVCRRRNAPAFSSTAISSNRWKCPHCPYVQCNRRSPDLKRHVETHTRDPHVAAWVCCGVPLENAIDLGVPCEVVRDAPLFDFDGVTMIEGCRKVFSRRDALMRHLRKRKGACYGDAGALHQPGNRLVMSS